MVTYTLRALFASVVIPSSSRLWKRWQSTTHRKSAAEGIPAPGKSHCAQSHASTAQ